MTIDELSQYAVSREWELCALTILFVSLFTLIAVGVFFASRTKRNLPWWLNFLLHNPQKHKVAATVLPLLMISFSGLVLLLVLPGFSPTSTGELVKNHLQSIKEGISRIDLSIGDDFSHGTKSIIDEEKLSEFSRAIEDSKPISNLEFGQYDSCNARIICKNGNITYFYIRFHTEDTHGVQFSLVHVTERWKKYLLVFRNDKAGEILCKVWCD